MNAVPQLNPETMKAGARGFIIAWVFALIFYFLEYAVRSAPSVMIPQLAAAFGTTAFGVSSLVGVYYHTYSLLSLGAGAAMIPYSVICSWTDWRGRAAS